MRQLALLLIGLASAVACALSSRAATVDATFSFMDITSRSNQVTSLTISGLCRNGDNGSSEVFGSPRTFGRSAYPAITNGFFTISNIQSGFGVQVVFADGWTVYSNQYCFPTGLTGAVSAITYKSVNVNRLNGGCPYQPAYFYLTNALTKAQADLLYTPIGSASTNVFFTAASPSNSISANGAAIAFNTNGMVWINRNGASNNWLVLITTNR